MPAMIPMIWAKKNVVWPVFVATMGSIVFLSTQQFNHAKLPCYAGKSITAWFDREVSEDHRVCGMVPRSLEARTAILQIGDDAVPFLVSKAQQKPSFIGDLYDGIVCRLPLRLMSRFSVSDNYLVPMQRSTAIGLLGEIVDRQGPGTNRVSRISPERYTLVLRCLTACTHTNETVEIRSKAIEALASLSTTRRN